MSLFVYATLSSEKTAQAVVHYENFFDRIWLTDASGSIMQGGSELTIQQRQHMLAPALRSVVFAPTGITKTMYIAPLVFSHNMIFDWEKGSCHGVLPLYAQGETLNFTTKAGVANTNYNINILGLHLSGYRIQDGRLISMR